MAVSPDEVESSQTTVDQQAQTIQTLKPMTVYKSPTCGCCGKWVEYMEEAGFDVTVDEFANMSIVKEQHGVQQSLQSCHTALVGDYVVEGHVPVDAIDRLLAEQPDVLGLAAPGMPVGSPGMEIEGYENAPFDVLALEPSGQTKLFASYPK